MNTITLTIPFAAEGAGDGESRWIRLEQVEIPDEAATMEQAAELIDALYGIEPCEDGLGNGGEEADEEELPEEADFLDMAKERLELDICDRGESATWDAEVDVLRSHQDDAYNLQSERVEVGEITPMSKTVTETVELDGATCDLQWPCGGEVGVSAGEVKEVRGSTVNFAAPVKGRIRISYRAVWDRVKLKVRRGAAANSGGGVSLAGVLAASGGSTKTSSRDEDAASVVAFWRDLAAECSLNRPPEDDQDIDRAEIERICNPKRSYHLAGECWQRTEHYNLCNCSGREAPNPPEPEDIDAPCPEGTAPGAFLGTIRELGEYVDCPGEDEGLADGEFFRAHCCKEGIRFDLPRCEITREPWQGGEEIEGGPERYKAIYGESVRLTAVTPEGGRCGELIRHWAVPEPLPGPPELPEKLNVRPGQAFSVSILRGGRPPFVWTPPAGVRHLGDAAMGFMGLFRADDDFRGGWLTVTDACGRSTGCMLRGFCRWTWVHLGIEHPDMLPDRPYDYDPEYPLDTIPPSAMWDRQHITFSANKLYFFSSLPEAWTPGDADYIDIDAASEVFTGSALADVIDIVNRIKDQQPDARKLRLVGLCEIVCT